MPSAAFAALSAVCVSLPPAPYGAAERISPDQLPAVRQAAERGDAGTQYALGDCYAAKAGQPRPLTGRLPRRIARTAGGHPLPDYP